MINKATRLKIKGYLEGFVQGIVNETVKTGFDPKKPRPLRTHSKKGDIKPFHEALLPDGILRVNDFERSFSTKLGSTFEEAARLIAEENHKKAIRGYRLEGPISSKAVKYIEESINEIGAAGVSDDYFDLIKRVVARSRGEGQERKKIVDLYVLTKNDGELFFEIKSPKPNKGQCLEATDRLLQIHAIKRQLPPKVRTFYAMAYNPFGADKKDYQHSFAVNYLDLRKQVLIGGEFWELIGGRDTYPELLEIYCEVGREKGPDMLDQLALGY